MIATKQLPVEVLQELANEFAAANLPHQIGLAAHIPPVQIHSIAVRVDARDWSAIELPQQDIRQGLHHRGRRS